MTHKTCNICNKSFLKSNFAGSSGRCRPCRNAVLREQRRNRKDEVNRQNRERYKLYKHKVKATQQKYLKKIRELQRTDKKWHAKYLLKAARTRARLFGLEFNLTLEDVFIPEYCPLLGYKLVKNIKSKKNKDDSATLDRIDSRKGYVKGNVMVISWKANLFKSNVNIEKIIFIGEFYKNHLNHIKENKGMSPLLRSKLRQLLLKHEGYKTKIYLDSTGHASIGIGRNLTDRGVLPTEIDLMFQHDTDEFFNFLSINFEWFPKLDEARQVALTDMCFMGEKNFLKFTKMLSAMADGNYQVAAEEILNSEYRKQVGQRALDIASIIQHGEL